MRMFVELSDLKIGGEREFVLSMKFRGTVFKRIILSTVSTGLKVSCHEQFEFFLVFLAYHH